MNPVMIGFDQFLKTALEPVVRTGALDRAHGRLMKPRKADVPVATSTKISEDYERMSAKKWKQTAKDVPLAILAGGIGYGLGRTGVELLGEHLARGGQRPGWLKAVPAVVSAGSAATTYAASRLRQVLKDRRIKADEE